ncbi:MAG: hypothetical protein ACK5XM_07900 [Betaproteobacteria bacterium]
MIADDDTWQPIDQPGLALAIGNFVMAYAGTEMLFHEMLALYADLPSPVSSQITAGMSLEAVLSALERLAELRKVPAAKRKDLDAMIHLVCRDDGLQRFRNRLVHQSIVFGRGGAELVNFVGRRKGVKMPRLPISAEEIDRRSMEVVALNTRLIQHMGTWPAG